MKSIYLLSLKHTRLGMWRICPRFVFPKRYMRLVLGDDFMKTQRCYTSIKREQKNLLVEINVYVLMLSLSVG